MPVGSRWSDSSQQASSKAGAVQAPRFALGSPEMRKCNPTLCRVPEDSRKGSPRGCPLVCRRVPNSLTFRPRRDGEECVTLRSKTR